MNDVETPRQTLERKLNRLQRGALLAALVGGALCALGYVFDAHQFYQAYLLGYVYWWAVTTGCLALALLFQMTGGAWGVVSRPFFESGTRTLPLMALLFVPVGLGLEAIYDWTEPGYFAGDPHAHNRELYLDKTFFLGRSAGYFVVWLSVGLVLTGTTQRRWERGEPVRSDALGRLSGGGMVALVLTVSFAAFDWLMTLDPHWYSTIFGGLVAIGNLVAGMALGVVSVTLFLQRPTHPEVGSAQILNDLGNLLLAFVMLWTYFQLSQFLIIWSGNLPHEVTWYIHRREHGWQWLTLALFAFHFAVPFALLLLRDVKRNPRALGTVAGGLLIVHYVNLVWIIVPSFEHTRIRLHWLHLAAPVAVGGLWLAVYAGQLKRRLLPMFEELTAPRVSHTTETHSHG